jgi:hypothetical protein
MIRAGAVATPGARRRTGVNAYVAQHGSTAVTRQHSHSHQHSRGPCRGRGRRRGGPARVRALGGHACYAWRSGAHQSMTGTPGTPRVPRDTLIVGIAFAHRRLRTPRLPRVCTRYRRNDASSYATRTTRTRHTRRPCRGLGLIAAIKPGYNSRL